MNDASWDLYRTLLSVLTTGSLSAAARDLGLTQPTVGRHIDALEEAVGQQLFTRSQQGLLPTEQALALKPYAETMAATASAMARLASGALTEISGTVRIGASDVVGVEVLPDILTALQDRHPTLQIELSLSDSLEDLLNREADIAVRMMRPQQDALVARHVGAIMVGLFAHRRYIDRHGLPKTPYDLSGHRMIGYDRQTAYIRAMAERFRATMPDLAPLHELPWTYRADSNLAQLAAIRAGAGIGFCQRGIAARDADLIPLFADTIAVPLDTYVVMHENLKAAPRWRAVFDALVDGLRAYINH